MELIINEGHLHVSGYAFRPSSIGSGGNISYEEITEILPDRSPPEIVLKDNEVIFLDAQFKEELVSIGENHSIKISQRADIWALLNEPFLDTVHQASYMEHVMQELVKNQIEEKEINGIRGKVGDTLLIYNAILWEWQHLGHYDVLLSRKKYSLGGLTESFYWWTMKIALRNL